MSVLARNLAGESTSAASSGGAVCWSRYPSRRAPLWRPSRTGGSVVLVHRIPVGDMSFLVARDEGDDSDQFVIWVVEPHAKEEPTTVVQGPPQEAPVGLLMPSVGEEEVGFDAFREIACVIEDIRQCRPLSVSDELRALARQVQRRKGTSPIDDVEIEEWARGLAESVSNADD